MANAFNYGESRYKENDIVLRRMELLFKLIERGRERDLITEEEYDKELHALIRGVKDNSQWI